MSVKKWISLPFESRGTRKFTPYRASEPNNHSHPRFRDPLRLKPSRRGSNAPRGFELELARTQTHVDFADEDEEDLVRDYNAPVHMWVVATLFPLIAGTFGPMASMFNICAIVDDWRIIISADLTEHKAIGILDAEAGGDYIQDPKWLVGVNAVSLIIAIVANISLLGQMTNRVRYNISGPITIVGFFISGLVDVALVSAVPKYVPLPSNPLATWSQAYYYAAFSGAIYVILAMMLSVTAAGIYIGHYSDQFKLSLSQRSLMLQTMMFLGYILAAGAVYSRLETWNFLDAVYFVVITVFTIGFGDFVPVSRLARGLFFPMSVGGILYVGVIVANIRTLVLESGSVKVSTRMLEKARLRVLKSGNLEEGTVRLRGQRKRSITAEDELDRRRKEFEIMRAIQKEANQNGRIFSLTFALVAFCILWFIGGVVFWKAEMHTDLGGGDWTYYESIYFTFVAQLTIGYGDFAPTTEAGRPAFVFWALIALPTLTVLIGAIGDSISDFVNWYTVFIGKHTQAVVRFCRAMRGKDREDPIKLAKKIEEEEVARAQQGFSHIANVEKRSVVPLGLKVEDLSQEKAEAAEHAYRPLMILRAANKVVEHLESDPPKKYSWDEWNWLLKLIGEDEALDEGHRRVGMPLPDGAEVVTPRRDAAHHVWSWLGQESPLMSLEDGSEPKWILHELMRVLEDDLRERAERHVQQELGHQLSRTGSRERLDEKVKDVRGQDDSTSSDVTAREEDGTDGDNVVKQAEGADD